jgi:hypothetical protein
MKKANLFGHEVIIASPAECEQADFVVCGPVSYFPDDVHTTCAFCATPIVHRPHAPVLPPKICFECLKRGGRPQ